MRRTTVTFDNHKHLLSQTSDPALLQRAVVASVTSGVGFVDVDVAGTGTMSVLVTDRTSVVFESEEFEEIASFIGPENRRTMEHFDLVWS